MLVLLLAGTLAASAPATSPWRTVAPGLEVAELLSPKPCTIGDSVIVAVRIDPARYELRLLSAKRLGLKSNLTAREWVQRYGLSGAINACMYKSDGRTPLGYMRAGDSIVNGQLTKDNAVFAADPADPRDPPARILDRTCDDFDALMGRYRVLVQSIRMLGCGGENVWKQQERRWSTACIGTDHDGRVLFIHARSPWSTHDLIEILKALPLDLERLMYVEGGPEASLYVKVGDREVVSRMGSYETGFREDDGNHDFWPAPNVIGFAPKLPEPAPKKQ